MPLVIMPATNWTPVISWVLKRLPSFDVAVCAKSAAMIFAGCFGCYGLACLPEKSPAIPS